MIISAIVAVAKNNIIGKDNDIPWYLPADLKYFKKQTLGHHILMGRNCFESIGRPLPKRTNIVISRNPFFIASNCLVAHSVREGIDLAIANDDDELFIIGGGQIYDLTQPLWDRLYMTTVDLFVDGDVFFPEIDSREWQLISEEVHKKDDKNEYDYTFKIFERNKL